MLDSYLSAYEMDRAARNRLRHWSYRGLNLELFEDLFPSDSPYSLTTRSMIDSLMNDGEDLLSRNVRSVLDMGCGNGPFSLHLAMTLPQSRVVAVDKDVAALAATRWNARRLGLRNVDVVASDLFDSFSNAFSPDLIVATLPYAEQRRGANHLERFWAGASVLAREKTRVYFGWVEWADYTEVESIASRQAFEIIRWDEYKLEMPPHTFSWRVYVFSRSSAI